ncbi:MAG: ABC transporter substrate-binding protein [Anaerolineae bacterium]|nr:ABC transporter substrate-binding protein [Anaerolineae bacterium]
MTGEITIGALAILYGPFAVLGEDSLAGVEMAIEEFGGQINGKAIELITEPTDATADTAYLGAQKLIEKKNVDFVVGPVSGDEGIGVKEYALTRPDRTFINGVAGSIELHNPNHAPNFFSFTPNGAQHIYGLGRFVVEQRGYRRVVTLGEDYSYPHAQVGGFMVEYQRAGGQIVQRIWSPLGTTDYSSLIAEIPQDIDAILVCLGGGDAINFLEQYMAIGRSTPLIGGTILADQTVLNVGGELSRRLAGTPWASPVSEALDTPIWKEFAGRYWSYGKLAAPSLFAWGYYVSTKAALLALQQIGGELSEDQENFRAALRNLQFEGPTGLLRLDHHQQAISTIFINELAMNPSGELYVRLLQTIPNVTSTLGLSDEEFTAIGNFTAENPPLA